MKKLFLFTILFTLLGTGHAHGMNSTVFSYQKQSKEINKLKKDIDNIYDRLLSFSDHKKFVQLFKGYKNLHKLTIDEINNIKKSIIEIQKIDDGLAYITKFLKSATQRLSLQCLAMNRITKILISANQRHSLKCLAMQKLSGKSVEEIKQLAIPRLLRKKLFKKLAKKGTLYLRDKYADAYKEMHISDIYEKTKEHSLNDDEALLLLTYYMKKNQLEPDDNVDLNKQYSIVLPQEIVENNQQIFTRVLKATLKEKSIGITTKNLFDLFAIYFLDAMLQIRQETYEMVLAHYHHKLEQAVRDAIIESADKQIKQLLEQIFDNCSKETITSLMKHFNDTAPQYKYDKNEDKDIKKLIAMFDDVQTKYEKDNHDI